MASKEKVKRKKAEKGPKLPFARKKSKKSIKHVVEEVQEDVTGSKVSVRSASKDNIKDNTEKDPDFAPDYNQKEDEFSPTPDPSERPRSSTSETKKTKSDHIDQKLDAEDKDSSLSPGDSQTRTPSPFRKNVVKPVYGEKGARSDMGSAVSLKSNASHSSLKEAWVEHKEGLKAISKSKRKKDETTVTYFRVPTVPSVGLAQPFSKAPSTSSSTVSLREGLVPTNKSDGLKGIKVEAEEDSPEKHAYIPYLYARNCIAKIMEDMKAQKGNHVLIVENIQTHYRTIEDETQQQFNMFVLCMRQDYIDKRKAFRQIIDVHKTELDEKERYWNEMLTSLAERNNKLLREKKVILTTNKIEIEKLEKEKAELSRDLTDKMDRLALMPDSSDETTEQVVEVDDKQAKTGTEMVTSELKEETDKAGNQKTGTKPKKALAGKVAKAGTLAVVGTQQVSEEPSKIDETAGSVSKESDKKAATKSEPVAKQAIEKSDVKTESEPGGEMRWEEEKKILQDELDTEKAKVTRLEEQIANGNITPGVAHTETATVEARESTAAPTGGMIAAGAIAVTKENNKEMERERKEMNEERMNLDEERNKYREEMENFGDERKKWLDEINRLQSQLGDKEMSDNEWKVKYETVKGRLDEAADTQGKYKELEAQYIALAALVKDSDTSTAVQEQIEKTKGEKVMMETEKQNTEKDIEKWEQDFEKKNKRKPTEDDMSDSVKEMYTTRDELEYMVNSLEKKEETLAKVESGSIPDPPVVSQTPIDSKEPEVVTVQVKVPDPVIVEELEKSHEEITIVRTEIITLQETITTLRTEMSNQKEELAKQRGRIAELEAETAVLKAGGTTVAPLTLPGTSVSEEEMESLKKENRELRKDMKKMIKQYTRLAERKKEAGDDADQSEQQTDLDQQIGDLDNKVADLEAENEALKEERTILKERVKTITETITITQTRGDGDKKLLEEKDSKIEELRQELEKLKTDNIAMHKDMKKMVKSYEKLRVKYDDVAGSEKAVRMLEIVAMLIHEIHGEVPDAAGKVNVRLEDYEDQLAVSSKILESRQQAYTQWVDKYSKKYGKEPLKTDRDREGQQLAEGWDTAKKDFRDKALHLAAIQLIKTGDMTKVVDKQGTVSEKAEFEVEHLEKQLSSADNKLIELESENETIKHQKDQMLERNQDLETQLEDLRKQLEMQSAVLADSDSSAELTQQVGEIQKKADALESELMQEKMSHVNTRDELEGLRKQLGVAKEELANEKEEIEAKITSSKVSNEAEKQALNEEIKALKERTDTLEAERLSNMPPDTAKEIQELQEKLKALEKEKTSSRTSSVTLNAQISELNTKLEVASKNLETQRAHNREIEAKLKSGRQDKEKEAKKMSRHMEEKEQKRSQEDKQRINMLVKRVKELEAKVGKGVAVVPVGGGGGGQMSDAQSATVKRKLQEQAARIKRLKKGGGQMSDAQTATMKRELQEQAARIKQLEADLKDTSRAGTVGAISADKTKGKQEKILKELEKKLGWEKDKSEKLIEGLKSADDENKTLKKEVETKDKDLVKVKMELKTLGLAAKEGVEAATKVKALEAETKRLGEENVTLTKNFESERVLRKKYYNMVEDMKGKIRVYCRSRPLSSDEIKRGNKAVVKSIDEYSISVEGQRGLKEFQYDQVFMEDSTQEKIFEDTNNLIQSAVDGYNVCIFAYGQTGSGKTFTMIGDKDQKFPGIAPRAFNRIFELIHDLRNKFKITVQAYMLELYNDKLIDLFAKPGQSDDDKLEIKKDKKGMVYIQGAVIKDAKNSKELFALFEEGSINRHTASTKMNAESSRSHLVVGIVMESTNKNTGNVTKGKLSLVDLAGSERVAKTGATAEQLKEAMSINKSLSALGDVISALSSEQQFIPYRNHKLTMLMQDSLGGNAKTLMFVNISPADYNADESAISLTYASRVKLITNDASKNADNKEIARLKGVIERIRKGERVDEEVE